jgi:anti-sigma regulatory factor (Ser/Thr protein kinase)
VPAARHFVLDLGWLAGEARDRLAILISELVTNAVLHAGTAFRVKAVMYPACIRIEVFDDSLAPPVMGDRETSLSRGRGLMVVDALSDNWGFDPINHGKVVWFELERLPLIAG